MMHSGLASAQTFVVYVAKYGVVCTEFRLKCTSFGYLRKDPCPTMVDRKEGNEREGGGEGNG